MSFYQNFKRKIQGKNGSSTLEDLKSDGQFITLASGDFIQKTSGETWTKIEGYTIDGVVMKYNNIFDKQTGSARTDTENDSRYVQLAGNNVLSGANIFNGNNTFNGTNKFTKPVTHTADIYSVNIDNSDHIKTGSLEVLDTTNLNGWVKIGEKLGTDPDQTTNLVVYGTTELVRDAKTDLDLTVGRNLTVKGTSNLQGNVNADLNLIVQGTSLFNSTGTFKSNLEVQGDSKFYKNVTVQGDETVKGAFNHDGDATFNGNVIIKGKLTSQGTGGSNFDEDVEISQGKKLTVYSINGSPEIDNLTVKGWSDLKGPVTCENTLTVTSDFNANGNSYFGGSITVNGNISNNDNTGDIGASNARWANIYSINQNNSGTFEGNVVNFNSGTCRGTITAGLFNGTATSARHADLAEKYSTDKVYPAGTVLEVNEKGESQGTEFNGGTLLGVVSEKPGLMINSEADGQYVALKGIVPVLVSNPVFKGQYCIADRNGKVRGMNKDNMNVFLMLNVVGVALEDSKDGKVLVKV